MDASVGVAATVGTGLVFTATVAAPKHVPSETATVYMALAVGLTTNDEPTVDKIGYQV
jgi:hypothetical protein